MKECKCKKFVWCILGILGLLAVVVPLVYAVVKVDKIPGLVINKEKEAKE